MIQDKDTNFVYIANKLSQWKGYSAFCKELISIFDDLKIPYGKIYDVYIKESNRDEYSSTGRKL